MKVLTTPPPAASPTTAAMLRAGLATSLSITATWAVFIVGIHHVTKENSHG